MIDEHESKEEDINIYFVKQARDWIKLFE